MMSVKLSDIRAIFYESLGEIYEQEEVSSLWRLVLESVAIDKYTLLKNPDYELADSKRSR